MKLLLTLLVTLACITAKAQPLQTRELTVQEAHSILEAYIPDGTKKLPGYGLDDSPVHHSRFYLIEVTRDNPVGSVVWGDYAIDKTTGDLWSAVVCKKISSRRIRAVQQEIRRKIGLSDATYKQIKNSGPLCETSN